MIPPFVRKGLLISLLLWMASCHSSRPAIDGFWTGAVTIEASGSATPTKVSIQGKSECLILRHRNSSLHIQVKGNYSGQDPLRLKINKTVFDIPVSSGRFSKSLVLTKEQLGPSAWCRISFSQPGIEVQQLHYSETRTYPKTIVFALDGATWRVLGKMVREKRLPHFQKLMRNGSYGILESVEESLSPVIWTTIATGRPPEAHGIHDFLDARRRPVHSGQVRVKRIWNILSEYSNYTTGVVGWYVTYPVEELSGFMISDRAFQTSRMKKKEKLELYYPREIGPGFEEIQKERAENFIQECARFTSYTYDPFYKTKFRQQTPKRITHDLLSKRLYHVYLRDSTYVRSGLELYQAFRPDVFFLYLRGNDYTQHAYWHYMEAEGSFQNPTRKEIQYFGKIVENYYVYLDEVLGQFMKIAPPDTTFVVLSDHGFRAVKKEEFNPARALSGGHEKEGVYIFSGPGIKKNHSHDGLSIMDVCPLLLYHLGLATAKDMSGKVPIHLQAAFWPDKPLYLATYGLNRMQTKESVTTGADEETMEQLRTLGYIDE